jgi:hypothetical protein
VRLLRVVARERRRRRDGLGGREGGKENDAGEEGLFGGVDEREEASVLEGDGLEGGAMMLSGEEDSSGGKETMVKQVAVASLLRS